MGSLTFWKSQYAKETVRGTAVTVATKRFYGMVGIPKDRTIQHPELALGVRASSGIAEVRQILADPVTLTLDNAYYQALPMMFSILLKGGVTATEQTVGKGDYLWDFTPDLTASGNPDTITLQTGDNDQAFLIEYLMGKKFTLDFATGEDSDAKVAEECFGKQISKGTFTAAISAPATQEMIQGNTVQMWMDGTWATLGTTAQTNLLRSGSVEIGSGNHPKFFGQGVKTLSAFGEGDVYGAAKFVFEGGVGAVAIFDAWQAATPKAIRLKFTGGLIAAGGLAHSLIVDLYGTFEDVIPLSGDKDGNTLYGATFATMTDLQSTQHAVGAKVSTSSNTI